MLLQYWCHVIAIFLYNTFFPYPLSRRQGYSIDEVKKFYFVQRIGWYYWQPTPRALAWRIISFVFGLALFAFGCLLIYVGWAACHDPTASNETVRGCTIIGASMNFFKEGLADTSQQALVPLIRELNLTDSQADALLSIAKKLPESGLVLVLVVVICILALVLPLLSCVIVVTCGLITELIMLPFDYNCPGASFNERYQRMVDEWIQRKRRYGGLYKEYQAKAMPVAKATLANQPATDDNTTNATVPSDDANINTFRDANTSLKNLTQRTAKQK